jgi:hypothetical protein
MMNSPTLQITTQTVGDTTLLGDVSTGVFRPLVPIQHREAVSSRCTLYTTRKCGRPAVSSPPGSAGHRWPRRYPDGQGLPTMPAGQGSQARTPTTNRDTGTTPPFRPPPRGPGRAAAAFARPHLPVHHHRPDIEMAGSHLASSWSAETVRAAAVASLRRPLSSAGAVNSLLPARDVG